MHEHFMKHGVFSWNELMTTDLEGAKEFYSKVLGWTFEESTMPTGDTYVVAKDGDAMLAGMFLKTKDVPEHIPPHWGSYVTVDDVDASAKQVEELGGTIIFPLTDIPGVGRFCVIQDPQGAAISMITYPKDASCNK